MKDVCVRGTEGTITKLRENNEKLRQELQRKTMKIDASLAMHKN